MKIKNNTWKVVITHSKNNRQKYCESNYMFTGTQQALSKKIEQHYNKPDKEYGKVEAVEVELIEGF